MYFVGESVIANGKLASWVLPTLPTNVYDTAIGYYLPVLQNFSSPLYGNGPVESRHFTIGGHSWCISYNPKATDGCISLRLFLAEDATAKPVTAHFHFSLVDETEKFIRFGPLAHPHGDKKFTFRGSDRGCEKFVTREFMNYNLMYGSLTFRCDLWVAPDDVIKTTA